MPKTVLAAKFRTGKSGKTQGKYKAGLANQNLVLLGEEPQQGLQSGQVNTTSISTVSCLKWTNHAKRSVALTRFDISLRSHWL